MEPNTLVRMPPSGGKLNGNGKPVVTTRPAIRTTSTRKPSVRVATQTAI